MLPVPNRSAPLQQINYMETGKPDLSRQDTNTATLICAVRHKNRVLWLNGKAQLIHGVIPQNRQCSNNQRYLFWLQARFLNPRNQDSDKHLQPANAQELWSNGGRKKKWTITNIHTKSIAQSRHHPADIMHLNTFHNPSQKSSFWICFVGALSCFYRLLFLTILTAIRFQACAI